MSNNLRTQVFISQRQAENSRTISNETAYIDKRPPVRSCEEGMMLHLGTIATMLMDISKSLAVIADKMESEE